MPSDTRREVIAEAAFGPEAMQLLMFGTWPDTSAYTFSEWHVDTSKVAQVVVGSQLHGLATPESDTDYAVVKRSSLRDMLSPFRKEKAPRSISEGGDVVTFELAHFIKLATSGNPTVLEVLWSNKIVTGSDIWSWLYASRRMLLAAPAIYHAHKGYAHSQVDRASRCPSDERRVRKAWAAHLRVLDQGIQLLDTGDFSPQVREQVAMGMRHIKDPNTDLETAEALFNTASDYALTRLDMAFAQSTLPETVNLMQVENFIQWAYLEGRPL
jgi:predicted nucleotidyltransferase